jgi:hypothetical protein
VQFDPPLSSFPYPTRTYESSHTGHILSVLLGILLWAERVSSVHHNVKSLRARQGTSTSTAKFPYQSIGRPEGPSDYRKLEFCARFPFDIFPTA